MKYLFMLAFLCFYSCSSSSSRDYDEDSYDDDESYHEDSNYKYEYRTGSSGSYEYNYDVEGTDSDGNSVRGNVNTSGKYGSGYIEDENGNEVEVETEWTDWGELEATDEDGNTYELGVE